MSSFLPLPTESHPHLGAVLTAGTWNRTPGPVHPPRRPPPRPPPTPQLPRLQGTSSSLLPILCSVPFPITRGSVQGAHHGDTLLGSPSPWTWPAACPSALTIVTDGTAGPRVGVVVPRAVVPEVERLLAREDPPGLGWTRTGSAKASGWGRGQQARLGGRSRRNRGQCGCLRNGEEASGWTEGWPLERGVVPGALERGRGVASASAPTAS